MDIIFKAAGCALISVILSLVISAHNKELSILLTTAVCCMIVIAMLTYFRPIIDFLQKLRIVGNIDHNTLSILLKASGIAMLSEITGLICADAGNRTLGKVLQLLAAVLIFWLSLPVLNQMIDLMNKIIGSV